MTRQEKDILISRMRLGEEVVVTGPNRRPAINFELLEFCLGDIYIGSTNKKDTIFTFPDGTEYSREGASRCWCATNIDETWTDSILELLQND